MNREFKFRIWDKNLQKFLTLDQFCNPNLEWIAKQEDYIVQEFTGLKDKNGKEIYEGDIVKIDNRHVKKVIFEEIWTDGCLEYLGFNLNYINCIEIIDDLSNQHEITLEEMKLILDQYIERATPEQLRADLDKRKYLQNIPDEILDHI